MLDNKSDHRKCEYLDTLLPQREIERALDVVADMSGVGTASHGMPGPAMVCCLDTNMPCWTSTH